MKNQQIYFSYWGKAKKNSNGETIYHPLVFHSLDVAAVGYEFLQKNPFVLNWISRLAGMKPPEFHKYFSFMLALHDVGKFADSFQNLCPGILKNLQNRESSRQYYSDFKHDSLGFRIWNDNEVGIKKILQERGLFSIQKGSNRWQSSYEHPLDIWMSAVTGHHGRPPKSHTNRLICDDFEKRDIKAISLFLEDTIPFLLSDKFSFPDCDMQKTKTASWYIAGLAVICDWLGSNTKFFPYQKTRPVCLSDYWKEACKKAKKAVLEISILSARPSEKCLKLEELLGSPQNQKPSPVQSFVSQLKITPSPYLFIIEDVTGSGKTEAALLLAHKLMRAGQGNGLYFALPTMATSNAMYIRLKQMYRKMFGLKTSLILSHSARDMVQEFKSSVLPEILETENHYKDQIPAGFHCKAWLADNRKKALLADVGVGTVDQALLAILPVRHQALRLLGLSNKILIVDEVHACDAYMNELLRVLLLAHARAGGSAILLSATLPQKQRQKLLASWSEGRGQAKPELKKTDYPLISCLNDKGLREEIPGTETHNSGEKKIFKTREETPGTGTDKRMVARLKEDLEEIPGVGANRKHKQEVKTTKALRETTVEFFSNKDSVEDLLSSVVLKKTCACWIRNTVKDAVSSYEDLKKRHPDWDISLFHARFALGDRLKIEKRVVKHFGKKSRAEDRRQQILIATQTVEQSLDLDFDVMISDLAPIDLLIQRAGRLKRHTRDEKGNPINGKDLRFSSCLYIYSPEWVKSPNKNWYAGFFPNAKRIYPDHGRLWLTAKGLKECGTLKIPENSRHLIEGVYGDDTRDKIPKTLSSHSIKVEGENNAAVSMAGWNALCLQKGYRDSSDSWKDEGRTPTRLGEETTTVYLACWQEGTLQPYGNTIENHAWPYSSVSVRAFDIKTEAEMCKIPEMSKIPQKSIEKCKKSLPAGGRWGVLLPLIPAPDSQASWQGFAKNQKGEEFCWLYNKNTGLRRKIYP